MPQYLLKILSFVLLNLITFNAHAQTRPPKLTFAQLQTRLAISDSVTVVNFWATWCKPCVKELPYFEQLYDTFRLKHQTRFLLVTLDFPEDYEKKLVPFLKAKKLRCPVVFLNEPNPNAWIEKIDSSWSGAIPATVIYAPDGKKIAFHSGDFENPTELQAFLLKNLKK